ncbi:hypothetical protein [Catelliglobosispora koreensis]|uniref:hypothetical protein n=1 Tax=Catelliglobosispora koreensis TaxID=129052 RepID=UPI00037CEC2B|nr:hypothetical protein [Catelliglobosispora koreensis]
MATMKRLGDTLLSRMVPKVDASALYVWVYYCGGYNPCYYVNPDFSYQSGNALRYKAWCHESSGGGCTNETWIGCCNI